MSETLEEHRFLSILLQNLIPLYCFELCEKSLIWMFETFTSQTGVQLQQKRHRALLFKKVVLKPILKMQKIHVANTSESSHVPINSIEIYFFMKYHSANESSLFYITKIPKCTQQCQAEIPGFMQERNF